MYDEYIENEMTIEDHYRLYLNNNNDGTGKDYKTGEPLKDFCEWQGDQSGYSFG